MRGEHGRGFAVVADEVRKLAERTTQATQQVTDSVRTIQTGTGSAVDQMNEGTQKVGEGVSLAEQAGSALGSIVENSNRVAGMIQAIAAATETTVGRGRTDLPQHRIHRFDHAAECRRRFAGGRGGQSTEPEERRAPEDCWTIQVLTNIPSTHGRPVCSIPPPGVHPPLKQEKNDDDFNDRTRNRSNRG